MVKEPRVSIVTVALNAAETIGATLDSVRLQTHRSTRQIVIDGGSTDGTVNVIGRHAASDAIVVSEPDGGLYDAMNKGIGLADGDFVLFLNAGDVLLHRDTVERALNAASERPADAYCGGVVWVNAASGAARIWHHGRVTPCSLYRSSVPHQGMLCRREMFERVGKFDLSFRIVADYEWCLRARLRHRCLLQSIPCTIAVFADGGVSTAADRKAEQHAERARARSMYFGAAAALRCRAMIRFQKIVGR